MIIKSFNKNDLKLIYSLYVQSAYNEMYSDVVLAYHNKQLSITGGGALLTITSLFDIVPGEEEAFKVAIDLSNFYSTLKILQSDIKCKFGKNLVMTKNTSKSSFALHTDFKVRTPAKPGDIFKIKSDYKLNIDKSTLATLKRFVSDDIYRPVLTQIYWNNTERGSFLVATDGFRLIEIKTDDVFPESILIDPGIYAVDNMMVSTKRGYIRYSSESLGVVQRTLGSIAYPDYETLFKEIPKKKVMINKESFLEALSTASSFAGSIEMIVIGDKINMTSFNNMDSGINKFFNLYEIKNPDEVSVSVRFNTQYLTDIIKSCNEDAIGLKFYDNNSLFIQEGNKRLVLLPLRSI